MILEDGFPTAVIRKFSPSRPPESLRGRMIDVKTDGNVVVKYRVEEKTESGKLTHTVYPQMGVMVSHSTASVVRPEELEKMIYDAADYFGIDRKKLTSLLLRKYFDALVRRRHS